MRAPRLWAARTASTSSGCGCFDRRVAGTTFVTTAATVWRSVWRAVRRAVAAFFRTEAIVPLVGRNGKAHDDTMFSAFCPRHGATVLLSSRNIRGLVKRPGGVELHWRCTC